MDGFYAAYFRDLDGNKLAAFYMGSIKLAARLGRARAL